MTKSMQLFSAFVIIVLISILGVWTVVFAQSGATGLTSVEVIEIKNAVESYFEIRYRALSAIHQEEPEDLVSKFTDGSPFLKTELDKLEIEKQHARRHHLEYSQYKFLLDFSEISIDPTTRLVSVSVVEGHDVVFEISKELSKTDPVISSMRNLQHSIKMRKEQNEWKIVSDQYNDYLWRFMKATGLDKDNLLQSMNESTFDVPQSKMASTEEMDSTCSLPEDNETHPYNRNGAVNYANQWAIAPPPYNHPPYDDFTDMGGDCTNFVSQAIHEGGNAEMVFGGTHGVGQLGWYYYDLFDRATAWNEMSSLFDFITSPLVWPGGPEGCQVSFYQAIEGDLVQYDWTNNGTVHGTIA